VLSGGISSKHSLSLQLASVALVVIMIGVLLYLCSVTGLQEDGQPAGHGRGRQDQLGRCTGVPAEAAGAE